MKILGIGANYCPPGQEKQEPPEDLMIFMKPDSSLASGSTFHYPDCSKEVFYEMEVVIKITKTLKDISEKEAFDSFDEIALGMDWTAKDLQREAKEKGWPWTFAKGFDESTFLSNWMPVSSLGEIRNLELVFKVNGDTRLAGNTKEMIATYEQIISYISRYMTLEPGDLIMTGTPLTPGPIQKGDHAEGFIGKEKFLDFKVV
ncbi:MAG: fumarylacetoacetate hydrolase family protein [Bacteroidota bacterium]